MMLFWTLLALMTAAAVFAVLLPLSREPRLAGEAAGPCGLSRPTCAKSNRIARAACCSRPKRKRRGSKISRRLLGAASIKSPKANASLARRRLASIIALAGIPALSLSLYLYLGAPEFPDAPLSSRARASGRTAGYRHSHWPHGTAARAKSGSRSGLGIDRPDLSCASDRTGDAIAAQENAIRLLGSTASREVALGEYIRIANGKISAEVQSRVRACARARRKILARAVLSRPRSRRERQSGRCQKILVARRRERDRRTIRGGFPRSAA